MVNGYNQGQNFTGSYCPFHASYNSSNAVQNHPKQQPSDAYPQERPRNDHDDQPAEVPLNFLLTEDFLASLSSDPLNPTCDADTSQTNQPSEPAITHAGGWSANDVVRRNEAGDGVIAGGLDLFGWPRDLTNGLPPVDDIATNGPVNTPDAYEDDLSGLQIDEWGFYQPDAALRRVAAAPLNLSVAAVTDQAEASSSNDAIGVEEDTPGPRLVVSTPLRQMANAQRRKLPGSISCALCPVTFTRPYNLAVHMASHENRLAHRCTVPGCEKRFNNTGGLRSHKKHVHSSSTA